MGDVVAYWGTFATPAAPGNGSFTPLAYFRAPLRGDHLYLIRATPIQIDNSAASEEEVTHRWVVTDTDGSGPTVYAQTTQTVDSSPGKTALVQDFLYAFSSDPFASNTTTFQLQASATSSTTSFTNVGGWNLYCLDVGSFSEAMNSGGLGAAPPPPSSVTTTYYATNSQVYSPVDGTSLGDDTFVAHGETSSGSGLSYSSMVVFDGDAIRADLVGATVQSASLGMYLYEATGSASLGIVGSTDTAPPATNSGFPEYPSYRFPNWQVPGYWEESILGGFIDDILAGDNSMILTKYWDDDPQSARYSKFAGYDLANRRPYIKITYVPAS